MTNLSLFVVLISSLFIKSTPPQPQPIYQVHTVTPPHLQPVYQIHTATPPQNSLFIKPTQSHPTATTCLSNPHSHTPKANPVYQINTLQPQPVYQVHTATACLSSPPSHTTTATACLSYPHPLKPHPYTYSLFIRSTLSQLQPALYDSVATLFHLPLKYFHVASSVLVFIPKVYIHLPHI